MNPTEKPPAGSSIPEIVPPKCPHCRESIPVVGTYGYQTGPYRILCIYCPHMETCGKTIHFQIFQAPPAPDADPSEPPKPKVWSPS
jgi:hypothetical protein